MHLLHLRETCRAYCHTLLHTLIIQLAISARGRRAHAGFSRAAGYEVKRNALQGDWRGIALQSVVLMMRAEV